MLKLAIQKKGRLTEATFDRLRRGGLDFGNSGRNLVAPCKTFPMELIFLRDDDIASAVQRGVADIGILGENVYKEETLANALEQTEIVTGMGLGGCRLSLAFPVNAVPKTDSELAGKRIATTYPEILREYCNQRNISCDIVTFSGSVEIAPQLGLSDGIMDIVSTGSTLKAHGLIETSTVMESEAILIKRTDFNEEKSNLLDEFMIRLNSAARSLDSRYLMMNAPKEALNRIYDILPGIDAPSVMELSTDYSKVAVHAVVDKKGLWKLIKDLKSAGASGILSLPIETIVE